MAKMSFKEGTQAQKARSEVAEAVKRDKKGVRNPFAVATAATKRMKPAARRRLAGRRRTS